MVGLSKKNKSVTFLQKNMKVGEKYYMTHIYLPL